MNNILEKYLLDAEGKPKELVAGDNPFKVIGFDKDKKRLGWVRVIPFSVIKECLSSLLEFLEGKEAFIFVGMGGSINGMKTLFSFFKGHKLFTLDNLDPAAISFILKKIKNIEKTLVISVSKSGTTQETQLLSKALKEVFGSSWQKHFLWIADPDAFGKIDSLGWQGVKKVPIQFDGQTDIGGRFSSPHTLIFLLPLFLLLKKDFKKLEQVYDSYLSVLSDARQKACVLADKYKDKKYAYFFPQVKGNFGQSLSSWIVQLFQESLGSKKEGFSVKTSCSIKGKSKLFLPLSLGATINNQVASLMAQMYFFQAFIAFYSALKNINFVDQEFVEKYKDEMRKLEGERVTGITALKPKEVIAEVKKRAASEHRFIEVVLYFYPSQDIIKKIKALFCKAFKDKMVFVFIGSDWNHQSYQAAFSDKNTFYVFLLKPGYRIGLARISEETLQKNVEKLKLISKATYLTLKEKSLLFSLS